MKFHCHFCNICVAEIECGKKNKIRKGAKIVCAKCISRLEIVDKIAKMAANEKNQMKSSVPDFLKDFFGMKK